MHQKSKPVSRKPGGYELSAALGKPACQQPQNRGRRQGANPLSSNKKQQFVRFEVQTNCDFVFYPIFVGFGILGWIRNGYDILNPFVKCKQHCVFLEKSCFEFQAAVFERYTFFSFSAESLYQNVHIDHRIIFDLLVTK